MARYKINLISVYEGIEEGGEEKEEGKEENEALKLIKQ